MRCGSPAPTESAAVPLLAGFVAPVFLPPEEDLLFRDLALPGPLGVSLDVISIACLLPLSYQVEGFRLSEIMSK
ncbi:hypothetical protein EKH55_0415 [Sinorhizobium alkalisoli]|nr:hypothetical protein EKH55_0415 [Sinorhizobium alkalisoli]